jgi:FKBP-type peptidyl-prolyl cis-trans isomerase
MSMNTKNIVIWVVVAIVVIIGGYFIYKSSSNTPATDTSATATASSTPADPNQVQAQEVAVGTGTQAKPGDTVSVLYVGQLQDGTVFDSSAAHDNQPLTFVLGAEGLIPGFQIGVNGMKEGGERLLAIPPALGYGTTSVKDASGKEIIPANSTIVFDVKLVKVAPATSTAATK